MEEMPQNTAPNTVVPPAAPAPEPMPAPMPTAKRGHIGLGLGTGILVVIAILVGASLYFWGSMLPGMDDVTLQKNPVETTPPPTGTATTSDEISALEVELNADMGDLEADLEGIDQAFE